MINRKREKFFYWLCLCCILIVSYRLYSFRYYPLLNSDDALSILMTHYYHLPENIYCWGQNRGGTIVPMMAQVFLQIGFSPVNAVSVSNYLLLLAGFLGFSTLFKKTFTKIILAICWFLPPIWFADSLRFPYGIQYCLLGLAVYFISVLREEGSAVQGKRKHLYLSLLIIIFIAEIWVSDLAAVSVFALLFTLFWVHYKRHRFSLPDKTVMVYIIAGLLLCAGFVSYAKSVSPPGKAEYLGVNSFFEAMNGLRIAKDSMINLLSFNKNMPLMSIYLYLFLIISIALMVRFARKQILLPDQKFWLRFFILDILLIFVVILFSRWALTDGYGRRFYICTYISALLGILLFVDNIQAARKGNVLKSVIIITAVIGSFSTVHFLGYVEPGSLQPRIESLSGFKKLGKCAIIADYWTSYLVSAVDPGNIKAIPKEHGGGRNKELVNEVFRSEYIYLVKNDWLEIFPLTIGQYWHLLQKDGEEFMIAGKSLCRYKKIN